MNNHIANKVHFSFWVISLLMLFWNVMGCVNFFAQLNPVLVASYRESEQAIIQGRPLWATIGFAVAVFGGVFGCVLLLLKNHMAFYLFVASLVGVIAANFHAITLNIHFGLGEIIGIIIMPFIVAIFLIWYAEYARGKGWLSTAT